MSQQPQTQPPVSTLAVVALVTSLLCFPVGLILAIVALVRIEGSKGALGGKTLAIVALCLNFLVVPMVGILAAIAIPNFVKFQCRSKQSEAKANLKSLFVAEEGFRAENNKYSGDLAAIQFAPRVGVVGGPRSPLHGEKVRYEYTIVGYDDVKFTAEARGTGEMTGDLWRITNNNDLVNVDNVCTR